MSFTFWPGLTPLGYGTSSGRASVSRFPSARPRSLITSPPLVGSGPTRTGASGLRLQGLPHSQPQRLQVLHQPQEHPLPRVPRQQSVDDPASRPDDLTRHPGSTPRRTSRTPSATATASRHGVSPPTEDAPALVVCSVSSRTNYPRPLHPPT